MIENWIERCMKSLHKEKDFELMEQEHQYFHQKQMTMALVHLPDRFTLATPAIPPRKGELFLSMIGH
jgi:hypothetical protein